MPLSPPVTGIAKNGAFMNTYRKLGFAALGAALAVGVSGASPAIAQTGKALYVAKGCLACHGPDGKAPIQPAYPKMDGQNAEYLVIQLKAYKSQERKGGQAVMMWGMAAQLNDGEMEKIADYLSKVK